jgi:16S rRNA (adenine1518-N6/adenine1519-N6)-dimethyltransferase
VKPAPPSLHRRTHDALGELDFRPSRRRGQNFLVDERVAARIVAAADVTRRRVVEIGPGLGALSERLAPAAAALALVELDAELAERLRRRFADSPAVSVVTADALAVDFDAALGAERPWRVVANLPYSVGSQILLRLIEERGRFDKLVLMLQREVAERIVAEPGGGDYGPLAIAVALRGRARTLFRVAPGSFKPRPKVESTVLEVDLTVEPRVRPRDEKTFRTLVRASFSQRRKMLRRALEGRVDAATFEAAGIDSTRRAETLSLEEFARLADAKGAG